MTGPVLEICVDDAAGLEAAVNGGADRIELCAALSLGGLTPSTGLMRLAAQTSAPAFAMIRPRGGVFRFSAQEMDIMRADIDAAGEAGLAGVVLGVSRDDHQLDERNLEILVNQAGAMGKTLHRVIDLVPDLAAGIETAVGLGFDRVLSSGGHLTAAEGVAGLNLMLETSAGRLSVMGGSGVDADNVGALLSAVPLNEVHASCSTTETLSDPQLLAFGFGGAQRRETSTEKVAALKAAILAATGPY
ncbi:MAG: copper homeostasis protein CutC [Stappiaceae bacterium]